MKRLTLVLVLVALVATTAWTTPAMAYSPPKVNILFSGSYTPDGPWSSTKVSVGVGANPASTENPPVTERFYSIGGTIGAYNWQSYTGMFIISTEGTTLVQAKAIDASGTESSARYVLIYISRTVKLSTPACSPTKPTHTKTTVFTGKITPAHKNKVTLTFTRKIDSTYKVYKKFSATATAAGKWTFKYKLLKGNYKLVASTAVDNVNGYRAGKSATRTFTVK